LLRPPNSSLRVSDVPTRLLDPALSFHYGVYGIALHSEIRLSLPKLKTPGYAEIELRSQTVDALGEIIAGVELQGQSGWHKWAHLNNGSTYVRWNGLGEFWVSADGRQILCGRPPRASMESFEVYLLGQALSCALVNQGFEPLHGTAIIDQGEAIVFLGDSKFGKSTLAASFVAAGYPLLTDDLLLLHAKGRNLEAYPGPPRLKLFPKTAKRFFGAAAAPVRMNPVTRKQIIPLTPEQTCSHPVTLRTIYVLAGPDEMRRQRKVRIEPIIGREAFLALVANTFNSLIDDSARLRRQIIETARFLEAVPVKRLSFPRLLARLPDVREAILTDSRLRNRNSA
jgi:hypothetical protein